MTRKQIEKLIRYLDSAVERLVTWEGGNDNPVPDFVYNNITSAIALLENELTFEEEVEPLDFKEKTYIEGYEDLVNSAGDED